MKHVKNIELFENRNFRDYKKYNDIIRSKFEKFIKIEKIAVCKEENGEITIEIKNWYSFDDRFIKYIFEEIGDIRYKISPANGTQIYIYLYNIPSVYFLKLDAEQYNL